MLRRWYLWDVVLLDKMIHESEFTPPRQMIAETDEALEFPTRTVFEIVLCEFFAAAQCLAKSDQTLYGCVPPL
jgi:hypothetical protein